MASSKFRNANKILNLGVDQNFTYNAFHLKKDHYNLDTLKAFAKLTKNSKNPNQSLLVDSTTFNNQRGLTLASDMPGNLLNNNMCRLINGATMLYPRLPTVRAIFLSGRGRDFCTGRDYSKISKKSFSTEHLTNEYKMYHAMLTSQVPFVTLLHGNVGVQGLAMALYSRKSVATSDTVFSTSELLGGALPDCGLTWFLSRLAFEGVGLWLALTGTKLGAASLRTLGLVDLLVPSKREFEAMRRSFGEIFSCDAVDIEEDLFAALEPHADFDSADDVLTRYLPYIDLCFGGEQQLSSLNSISKRLYLLSYGELKDCINERMQISPFKRYEVFTRRTRICPGVIRRWALNCLRTMAVISPITLNIAFEMHKKAKNFPFAQELLQRDFGFSHRFLNSKEVDYSPDGRKLRAAYVMKKMKRIKHSDAVYLAPLIKKYTIHDFFDVEPEPLDLNYVRFHHPVFTPPVFKDAKKSKLTSDFSSMENFVFEDFTDEHLLSENHYLRNTHPIVSHIYQGPQMDTALNESCNKETVGNLEVKIPDNDMSMLSSNNNDDEAYDSPPAYLD